MTIGKESINWQAHPYLNKYIIKDSDIYEATLSTSQVDSYVFRVVIDGDTIRIKDGDTTKNVRLAGLDTPEFPVPDVYRKRENYKSYSISDNVKWARSRTISELRNMGFSDRMWFKSMEYLHNSGIVDGAKVTLINMGTGRYGRDIVAVFVGDTCINFELIRRGLASIDTLIPLAIHADIWKAIARDSKMGEDRHVSRIDPFEPYREFIDQIRDEDDLLLEDRTGCDLPGATKIGLTWLTVPPERIVQVEQHGTGEIPTIRTPGSPVVGTGQLEKRIEMVIHFPNVRDMNHKLRPLVAQFIRTPFLPIENHHIRKICMDVAYPDQREDLQAQTYKDIQTRYNYNMDDVHITQNQAAVQEEATRRRREVIEAIMREEQSVIERYKSVQDVPSVDQFIFDVLNDENFDITDLDDTPIKLPMMCALNEMNVSTIPGSPQEMQVSLVLDIFNYSVYLSKLRYCKTHNAALKQAKYYNNLAKFKYPNTRKYAKNYSSNNVNFNTDEITDDISKSKPFKDFIKPLLTGTPIEIREKIKMEVEDEESSLYGTYVVKPGDSLSAIASRHNVSLEELITFNNIQNPDLINVGDELLLPEYAEEEEVDYIFWQPDNWLRPVSGPEDFNNLDWSITLSEFSEEERNRVIQMLTMVDHEILSYMEKLTRNIIHPTLPDTDFKTQAHFIIESFFSGVRAGWELLRGRGPIVEHGADLIKSALKGEDNYITFRAPFGIKEEQWPGALRKENYDRLEDKRDREEEHDRIVFGKYIGFTSRKQYHVEKVLDFFLALETEDGFSGYDLLELMKVKIEEEEHLRYGKQNEYNFRFGNREDLVIAGMSASMQHMLATLPVESHFAPTKQHMGRSNWRVQMTIQTCNDKFLSILSTLSKKAALSQRIKQHSADSHFTYNDTGLRLPPVMGHNGFFKMLGINEALFESFEYTTIDDRPGWWNITIRLTQADLDLATYEKLLQWGTYPRQETIDKIMKVLIENYSFPTERTREGLGVRLGSGADYKGVERYLMQQLRNAIARFLLNVLMGWRSEPTPITRMDSEWEEENVDDAHKRYFNLMGLNISDLRNNQPSDYDIDGGDLEDILEYIINHYYDEDLRQRLENILTVENPYGIRTWVTREVERELGHLKPDVKRRFEGFFISGVLGFGRDFNINDVLEGGINRLVELYVKQSIKQVISYDKQGLIEFLSKYDLDKDQWESLLADNATKHGVADTQNAKLYGCYSDLELPMSSKNLILPVDFYYLKEDGVVVTKETRDTLQANINYIYEKKLHQTIFMNNQEGIHLLYEANVDFNRLKNDRIFQADDWFDIGNVYTEKNFEKIMESEDESDNRAKISDDASEKLQNIREKILRALYPDSEVSVDMIPSLNMRRDLSEYYQYYDRIDVVNPKDSPTYYRNIQLATIAFRLLALSDSLTRNENASYDNITRYSNRQTREYIKYLKTMEELERANDNFLFNEGVYGVFSMMEIQKHYTKAISQLDDYHSRNYSGQMARAFPTYKLFFVEEDAAQWHMLDDYYMYNAVNSIEVVSSKRSATQTATIRLSNILENLTDYDALYNRENIFADQTEDEQHVFSIMAQEGTIIQINAGYSNHPDELNCIFVGRIVSVQPGEEMTLIAQSFGAGVHEKAFGGSDKKKFGAGSRQVTHGDVLAAAVQTLTGLHNLGSTSIWEQLGFVSSESAGNYIVTSRQRWMSFLRGMVPVFDAFFQFKVFDPRFENIYLPFTNRSVFWTRRILERLQNWSTYRMGFIWYVNNQSLWEIMNEMTLYRKDYITTLLPYNYNIPGKARQTIYFGPKNGLYRYTDLYDFTHAGKRQIERMAELSEISIDEFDDIVTMFEHDMEQAYMSRIFFVQRMSLIVRYCNEIKKEIDPAGRLRNVPLINRINSLIERIHSNEDNRLSNAGRVIGRSVDYNIPRKDFKSQQFKDFFDEVASVIPYDYQGKIDEIKSRTGYDMNAYNHWEDYFLEIYNIYSKLIDYQWQYNAQAVRPVIPEERKSRGELPGTVLNIQNPDALYEKTGDSEQYEIALGYKPIYGYHYIDSVRHIVENNIRASSEELYNKVILRYASKPKAGESGLNKSFELFADDDITEIKTLVSAQRNLNPLSIIGITTYALWSIGDWKWGFPPEAIVGTNVLANHMQPMYRGELILIGDSNIKPWDILFVNDINNNMWGPIEAETVIHKINQDGFVTIVEPNAVIVSNDPARRYEIESQQAFFTLSLGRYFAGLGLSMVTSAAMYGVTQGFTKMLSNISDYTRNAGAGMMMSGIIESGSASVGGSAQLGNILEWSGHGVGKIGQVFGLFGDSTIAGITSAGVGTAGGYLPFQIDEYTDTHDVNTTAKAVGIGVPIISGLSMAIWGWPAAAVVGAVGLALLIPGASIIDWTIGKFLGRDTIHVIGLHHNGQPFVAGVRGMRKNTMMSHWMGRVGNILSLLR